MNRFIIIFINNKKTKNKNKITRKKKREFKRKWKKRVKILLIKKTIFPKEKTKKR
jgi:hypothetical protein